MKRISLIMKRTCWLMALAVFVSTGCLWAADGDHLTKEEVKTLIGSAKTSQDHERLAKHFDFEADQLEAEADEHQELAKEYKANPTMHEMKHPMSGKTAGHCQYFADDLHKAAKQARELAADHREMSKQVPK